MASRSGHSSNPSSPGHFFLAAPPFPHVRPCRSINALLARQAGATPVARAAPLVALLRQQGGTTLDPSSIPAQCESQCGSVINSINTCPDITCLCSDADNKGLYSCFECALSLQPDAAAMTQAQSSLTQFENTCNQAGVPGVQLASLTLTMPTGTSATSSGASAGSNPTETATIPSGTGTGTVNTVLPAPTNSVTSVAPAATSSFSLGSNPLARNGAGMVSSKLPSLKPFVAPGSFPHDVRHRPSFRRPSRWLSGSCSLVPWPFQKATEPRARANPCPVPELLLVR